MVEVPLPSAEKIKMVCSTAAAVIAVVTGYIALDGPLPATRQWVLAQNDQLKSRLIDNSLQTNRLELELLRREQFDRKIEATVEQKPEIQSILTERLNSISDSITATITKNQELQQEKAHLLSGGK